MNISSAALQRLLPVYGACIWTVGAHWFAVAHLPLFFLLTFLHPSRPKGLLPIVKVSLSRSQSKILLFCLGNRRHSFSLHAESPTNTQLPLSESNQLSFLLFHLLPAWNHPESPTHDLFDKTVLLFLVRLFCYALFIFLLEWDLDAAMQLELNSPIQFLFGLKSASDFFAETSQSQKAEFCIAAGAIQMLATGQFRK